MSGCQPFKKNSSSYDIKLLVSIYLVIHSKYIVTENHKAKLFKTNFLPEFYILDRQYYIPAEQKFKFIGKLRFSSSPSFCPCFSSCHSNNSPKTLSPH